MKKAAIYIRVSSERQGEKISPQAQEEDCESYCEDRKYIVVDIYRDIKRYRSKGKMVEPSGTRNDRPGFKRMLNDVDNGEIDVIVAWREDRLYRGVNRAMLEINERVTEKKVEVELAKEHYDPTVATVKAWAAGVELQAKRDRFMMGMAARLAKGKPLNHPPPYGYSKDEESCYIINSEEAEWILKLFDWYANDVPLMEIRRRFINGGARQRKDNIKIPWKLAILREYLKTEYYLTGVQLVRWGDKTYEIPIPQLVKPELAQRVAERFARYKQYPAGNAKHDCLVAGLLYCVHCGIRMAVRSTSKYIDKEGKEHRYFYYYCPYYTSQQVDPCSKSISARKVDKQIWDRVWMLIEKPGRFEQAIEQRIEELASKEIDAEKECRRLEKELDEISFERQRVITFARKELISEDDLDTQLHALSFEENSKRKELDDNKLLLGNRAERLMKVAEQFREQVKVGIESINANFDSPELEKKKKEVQNKIVHSIIKRAEIDENKNITIDGEIEFPEFFSISTPATRSCC